MKLIIVDDKAEDLYMLETLLRGSGYEVVSAKNGVDALEKLKKNSVEMIISDILMPKMDGFQLCRECKSDDTLRKIPFVFYTATYTNKKDEEFALSLGAEKFIIKPVEPDVFLRILEGVIEEHRIGALAAPKKPIEKRAVYLAEYNERLIQKLEKKMLDLERELTEHKRTEDLLRNAEADWRNSFNSLDDVMLIIDREYNIENINEVGLKLLGKSKEDVIGKKCYQVISGADSPIEECPCRKSLETKKVETFDRYEERFGKYYSIQTSPIFDDNGEIIKFVDLRRDITERKKAEEKIQILKNAIDESIFGISMATLEGINTYVNKAAYRIWGYDPEQDVLEDTPGEIALAEPEKFDSTMEQLIKNGYWLGELVAKRKDGSCFDCQVSASIAKNKAGEPIHIIASYLDITERKRAGDQLKASLKEKEVLLREIHHRVKNNLQVISSLLTMQARANKNKNVKDILSESRNRINTMALIHSQLYEGGNLSEINMKGFMDKLLVQLLQIYSVPDRKITPVVHAVECSLPISIAVHVGLIVNELLTNAFKHAFVNRKEGKIEVSFGASEKGAVDLTVSDDGVGLPEGFDINASETLGLRVVKILAEEQLDGKLEVVSDKGATFKVEFEMGEG